MNFLNGQAILPTASALAKLVKKPTTKNNNNNNIDVSRLGEITSMLVKKNSMSNDMLTLLPDIEFCADTSSASIVSPNDLTTKTFGVNFKNLTMGSELKGTLSELIKQEVNSEYNTEQEMVNYVKNSLFMLGADVEVYIPEASLNEIITDSKTKSSSLTNGYGDITVESANKNIKSSNKGIFGKQKITLDNLELEQRTKDAIYGKITKKEKEDELTVESANKQKSIKEDVTKLLNIEFTDDLSLLFSGKKKVQDKVDEINKIYNENLTTESAITKEAEDILSRLFLDGDSYEKDEILSIKEYGDTDRASVSRPLKLRPPMEITKPIWAITPDNHIGYILALDENHHLVTPEFHDEFGNTNKSNIPVQFYNSSTNTKDNLISKAVTGLTKMTETLPDLNDIQDIYGDILHKTIEKKIKDSKFKDIGEFSKDQKFLNMMFTRALEGKKTKLIFLPESLVSYFAYDYHSNGVGRSRVDKISVILSMRVIMLYAKLMANIKNSIPLTKVTATIDPKTPDVIKAVQDIVTSTTKLHQMDVPIGTTNINDIATWGQYAGMIYNIESDRLPDTKIDIQDTSRNIKTPEDTVSEILEELSYMAFFMNTAMVQGSKEINYAVSIITQNKLYENRIVSQTILTEKNLTVRIKKILRNDAVIREKLILAIEANLPKIKNLNKELFSEIEVDKEKNKKIKRALLEKLCNMFIDNLEISLPRPSSYSEGNNLKSAFQDYKTVVEEYIELIFSDDNFTSDAVGDLSEDIPKLRNIMKIMLLQDWVAENNHMATINQFLTLDEDGVSNNDILTKYSSFVETFSKLANNFKSKNEAFIKKNDKAIEKIKEKNGESDEEDEDDGSEGDVDDTKAGTTDDGETSEKETGNETDESNDLDKGDSNKDESSEDDDI